MPSATNSEIVFGKALHECVHCGLCLSACPTYVELGTEMDSPRGRIYLMRELEEGRIDLTADVVQHFDSCLGCRACETSCPSGVRYGELIETARAVVEQKFERPLVDRALRAGISAVFPRPERLRLLLSPVRLLQRLRVWRWIAPFVPFGNMVPQLPFRTVLPELNLAAGPEQARVGLLAGCVAREMFGQVNAATIRVLNRNCVSVVIPPAAGCCGALALHNGDPERARQMGRELMRAFPANLDAILVNAAGCGAALKEYGHLFADDPRWRDIARAFASKVKDISEYLHALPIEVPKGRLPATVTYHDACHLAHGQHVRHAPRELLRMIPGVELVELAEADMCCGSAGSYNLTEPAMAQRLGRRKVRNIIATHAEIVVAANPGCALQIQASLRARGKSLRVAHPVELLDEAYRTR